MPELPEVETIRLQLHKAIKGKTIDQVEVHWPKMVSPLSVVSFGRKLKGVKIEGVDRRAKMIVINLAKDHLAVHLKMTGQLIFIKKGKKPIMGGHPQEGGENKLPNKFTHIIIHFIDGSTLYFNDMRKFGWMRVLTGDQLKEVSDGYGVEVLSSEFGVKKFQEILDRYPKRKIKQTLLDQKLIAGIGNIYADEACFCAGILPTRITGRILPTEAKKLHGCIRRILKSSIEKGGTSSKNYVNLEGKPGGFVPYLKVYGRAGELCKKCKHKLKKDKVAGRGTVFCSHCQK